MRLFEALPQDQRDAIIDPKNVSKVPVKESTPVKTVQEEDSKTPTVTPNTKKQGKQRAGDAENDQVCPFQHFLTIIHLCVAREEGARCGKGGKSKLSNETSYSKLIHCRKRRDWRKRQRELRKSVKRKRLKASPSP